MIYDELAATIDQLVEPGKGILAADESTATMGKRLASINAENSEQNRKDYRLLLATSPDIEQFTNGVILFEETLYQTDANGKTIAQLFAERGIVPGIKVDKGLVNLANTEGEKVTQGLDGLSERLLAYKEAGAKFAKWRNVYSISEFTPSMNAIKAGAEMLARYAIACQEAGIVPIVEPEILMDGSHSIEQSAEVSEIVLHEVFHSLFIHQADLEHLILKPSMVIAGTDCAERSTPEEVAEFTLSVFRNNVPAAVPSINFLSGGQTPEQASENLNAINSVGQQPWNLTFSYGRALQEPCIKAWLCQEDKKAHAQQALLKRCRLNSAASMGEYTAKMEEA